MAISSMKVALLVAAVAVGSFERAARAQTTTAVDTSGQVDPSATCPWQLVDQIQACRATVYQDEADLSGGPCHDGDWPCICNVQAGLVMCYDPCPGTAPSTDVNYNNQNCNGQNGVVNAAASSGGTPYSGSPLTTTVPASLEDVASSTSAATVTTGGASTTASTTSSSATSTSSSSAASSSAGRPTSSPTNTSPTGSAAAASTTSPSGDACKLTAGSLYALVGAVIAGVLAL